MHIKSHLVNIEQKHLCSIGIHARDCRLGKTVFSYKEMEQHTAASSIKLFFAAAVLDILEIKNYTLTDTVSIKQPALIHGASILADLSTKTMNVADLLYFLLTHSDTSAQNILETIVSPKQVNEYIQKNGFSSTFFVSNRESTKTHLSYTTPQDTETFMERLWNRTLLNQTQSELFLTFLSKTRYTHFSLRNLPTSLICKDPIITKRFSKAGKVHNAINDTFLVETTTGAFCASIFIDNFIAHEKQNSVDHEGILLISELSQKLFTLWNS